MPHPTDIRVVSTALHFLPVKTRVPLKFGTEALTSVTCARAAVTVADASGRTARGWGETPLSVQWVWPSKLPYEPRHAALKDFCATLARELPAFKSSGHPMEISHDFLEHRLHALADGFNSSAWLGTSPRGPGPLPSRRGVADSATATHGEPMPYLAALVCMSVFDIALHDAFGVLHGVDIYKTYNNQFMSRDLAHYLSPREPFIGKYPCDFLVADAPKTLPAWHLVGGLDALEESDLKGDEPHDGYPVLLRDWIRTDGLQCLKVKLRGNDAPWDYDRLVRVGRISIEEGVKHLSADFNCTVTDPAYVNDILDRLRRDEPRVFGMTLYVEQPFPYDLEKHRIDVRSVTARKPLFLDESAHDWKFVKLGRELGWSGVALKTCKTQTGALLSLCWAKAHGMPLMVQDLTNPMLAMIPHARLAAHAGTIMGVETNAMQFYPDASKPEEAVHPGLYKRRNGSVDLSTIRGPGFGYRLDEIRRIL